MLFKKNDKIAIIVKPKTHNGFVNDKDYFNRYGEMREGSKFLVSKNILVYWDTQAENFRSFNLSNIVSITNLSRTPLEVNKKEKEKIEREKRKVLIVFLVMRPCNTTIGISLIATIVEIVNDTF